MALSNEKGWNANSPVSPARRLVRRGFNEGGSVVPMYVPAIRPFRAVVTALIEGL